MPDLDSLRRALRRSPGNTALLMLYAQRCLDDLQLTEARQAFERLLTHEPTHADAQLGVARVLFLDGKTSEAAVRTERILREQPDYAPGHLFLSRIHLAENNRIKAIEEYHKALAVDSGIGDPGLEKELGGGRPPRRPTSPVASERRSGGDFFSDEDSGMDDELDDLDETDWRSEQWDQPVIIEPGGPGFSSVGGMDRIKREFRRKLLEPLKEPNLFHAYGQKPAGGILLYGPPGCGKTMISRALAAESRAKVFQVSISEVFDSFIGNTEKNLRLLFDVARQQAPSVLFFDEIDSVAPDRKKLRDPQMRNVVSQFLTELDSVHRPGSQVLVVGTTNTPWTIDPQFVTPGRFDRPLFVPPPNRCTRAKILRQLLADRPTGSLDMDALARASRGFSGADLRGWVDRACHLAIEQSGDGGGLVPITTRLMLKARAGLKSTCKTWFHEAQEQVRQPRARGLMADFMQWLDRLNEQPRSQD